MGVRQYIGARYVPKFFENSATGDSTWAPGTSYEPLTIVAWNDNSYTSKKAVPPTVGAPNLNLDYWVLTGDIGSGIGALSERMDAAESDIDDLEEDVNDIKVNTDFFLYPTGDNTDRAADIAEKLSEYGVCYFANGDYYVYQEITMPEGASLIGVGNSKLHLMYDGVLIRMNSYCNVSGLTLIGQNTQIPYEAFSKGSRVGIYIDGDASSPDSSTYTRNNNIISDVRIYDFNGSAIKCNRTGGSKAGVMTENVIILRCHTGIDIPIFSEFNAFNNVTVRQCNIACVMQAGNNLFTGCHFTKDLACLKVDGTNNTLINADHSSFVGCEFAHASNNTGKLLDITGVRWGLTFVGCNIWHGSVDVAESNGIVIVGCIIGMTGNTFSFYNCTGCIINSNKFMSTLPAFVFTGSSYTFDDNLDNNGEIIIQSYIATGVTSSAATPIGKTLKKGSFSTITEVIGYGTNSGTIIFSINLPFDVRGNYTFEVIGNPTILGGGTVSSSDVQVLTKGFGYVRCSIPYASAVNRDAYLINISYTVTKS